MKTTLFLMSLVVAGSTVVAAPPKSPDTVCRIGQAPVPGFATKTLRPEAFHKLHAAVQPGGAGERWTEIGWQPDLVAARRTAARENKPLLLWIMDGHPLGCT